jgi:hypothetical protein
MPDEVSLCTLELPGGRVNDHGQYLDRHELICHADGRPLCCIQVLGFQIISV